jgi:DNA repair protein RecN (Recombination protein N)
LNFLEKNLVGVREMIKKLRIKNFAIIKDISIDFEDGLNVLSGETGAGKSIIVESVSFLFGSKYYGKDNSNQIEVSAIIKIPSDLVKLFGYGDEIEIKRIYDNQRKSRYFINSKPVSFSEVSNISKHLIDFHSQMENLIITSSNVQTEILDEYLGISEISKKFSTLYKRKKEIEEKIKMISMNEEEKKKLLELYTFQLNELKSANLKENEDIELEEFILKAKNKNRVRSYILEILSIINSDNGVYDGASKISRKLDELKKLDSNFTNLDSMIETVLENLKEIIDTLEKNLTNYDISDELLDEYIKRDEFIKLLKKKHSVSDIKGLLLKLNELEKSISEIKSKDENIEKLNKELIDVLSEMEKLSEKLDNERKKGSQRFSDEIVEELKKLGFTNPSFCVGIEVSDDFNIYGKNDIEFLFSANPDGLLSPLRNVASGGEISRIMLAIKSVSAKFGKNRILIFDEIDSGIGGNTAFFVGEVLGDISSSNQILLITHMPQVAVFANAHFKVEKIFEKSKTNVIVKKLTNEKEKIEEIARMFGSTYSPKTALKHAKEILERVKDINKK